MSSRWSQPVHTSVATRGCSCRWRGRKEKPCLTLLSSLAKTKGGFPNENSLLKLLYVSIKNASKKWTIPFPNWNLTLSQLAIYYRRSSGGGTGFVNLLQILILPLKTVSGSTLTVLIDSRLKWLNKRSALDNLQVEYIDRESVFLTTS